MSRHQRRGLYLVILGILGLAGVIFLSRGALVRAAAAGSSADLGTALLRVGLSAAELTTAGVSEAAVGAVVAGVEGYLLDHPTALAQADQGCFSAKNDADRLGALVRSGLASPGEVTACQQALADLASAESARQAVLDALLAAGAAELTDTQQQTLARLRANGAAWESLPLPFLVLDRSQTEWVRLRAALANERIAAKNSEEPDAGDQTYLSTCRADDAVAAATTRLETNLVAVQAAWEDAVTGG
ncbi:MAG: hypothetical protein AB1486_07590 [Planctomycetota bacterium]